MTPVRSAQKIVDVLSAQGVQYIFGVPGAKIDAVYDALLDGGPELVVCRHEQNAAFMAAAVGRLTGIPGVVLDVRSYAAAFGAHGYRVSTLDDFSTTLQRALAEDGPSLIDVPVDYSRNVELAAHLHDDTFE